MSITPEEWAVWKNQKTTLSFLKYLEDYRKQIAEEIAAGIFEGIPVAKDFSDEAALRCQIMQDIQNLTCDEIQAFYKTEEEVMNDPNSGDEREAD